MYPGSELKQNQIIIKTLLEMRNLIIKALLLVTGLGVYVLAGAQTVKGVVKDANGEGLPGVSVMIQGTTGDAGFSVEMTTGDAPTEPVTIDIQEDDTDKVTANFFFDGAPRA